MKCPTKMQISSFVDGELPESEAASVEEHMKLCDECRQVRETMVSLNASLSSLGAAVDSKALAERVKASIAKQRETGYQGLSLPLWARGALVTAILVIAVGLGAEAGTRVSELYYQDPYEVVLDQLASETSPGFAAVMVDLGSQENTP